MIHALIKTVLLEIYQYNIKATLAKVNLFGRRGLLGKQHGVNVGKHTTRSDGNSSEKLVQFFVVLDCQGDVTRHDTTLLVVSRGVSGQFEDFGRQVFQHRRQIDRSTGSHARGILSLTQVATDTTNWELQTSLGRQSGGLFVATASLSFSCDSERRDVSKCILLKRSSRTLHRTYLFQT
jgi:hypothetical protein